MDAAEARKHRRGPTLVDRMKAADPTLAARIERLVAAADAEARTVRRAEAFFLARLAKLVGGKTVATAGDDEFNLFVRVPVSRLHELSPQISDLQREVQERFGISLSELPIVIPDRPR
jgi:hypothetical protein